MKKINKINFIVIGLILSLMLGITTPAFATTQTLPVITLAKTIAAKTTKNAAVKSVLTAKDSKGCALTFTLLTKAAHGSVSLSKATTKGSGAARTYTITASYTPAKNYVGSDSYTVSAKDVNGNKAASKVTVTVSASAATPKPVPTPTTPAPAATPTPTTTPSSTTTPASDTQDINKIS